MHKQVPQFIFLHFFYNATFKATAQKKNKLAQY